MTDRCRKCGDMVEYKEVNGRKVIWDPMKRAEHVCLADELKFRRECKAQTDWEWAIHGEDRRKAEDYFQLRERERAERERIQVNGAY